MEKITTINIRPFKEEDFEATSSIFFQAFRSKFKSLSNLSDEKMICFLKESGFIERDSFEGYVVAEKDDEIFGVMQLKWKGQKRHKKNQNLKLVKLGNKYGYLNLIRILIGVSILSENISDGECYIEHIAVRSNSRGLGIGTLLLEYGKKIVESRPYLNKLTLYVAENNVSALQLYQKLGFSIRSSQNSVITEVLLKERKWIYMSNNVKGNYDKVKYTMQSNWWLGFLGFVGFTKLSAALLFLKGNASPAVLLGLLWFLWFSFFIPQKK